MEEYICEAVKEGYTKIVQHVNGPLFICNAPTCKYGNKILRNLCKVNGVLLRNKENSKLRELSFEGKIEKLIINESSPSK